LKKSLALLLKFYFLKDHVDGKVKSIRKLFLILTAPLMT